MVKSHNYLIIYSFKKQFGHFYVQDTQDTKVLLQCSISSRNYRQLMNLPDTLKRELREEAEVPFGQSFKKK